MPSAVRIPATRIEAPKDLSVDTSVGIAASKRGGRIQLSGWSDSSSTAIDNPRPVTLHSSAPTLNGTPAAERNGDDRYRSCRDDDEEEDDEFLSYVHRLTSTLTQRTRSIEEKRMSVRRDEMLETLLRATKAPDGSTESVVDGTLITAPGLSALYKPDPAVVVAKAGERCLETGAANDDQKQSFVPAELPESAKECHEMRHILKTELTEIIAREVLLTQKEEPGPSLDDDPHAMSKYYKTLSTQAGLISNVTPASLRVLKLEKLAKYHRRRMALARKSRLEKSIARRRFEQDMESRKAAEELELNSKFRANPVPVSSVRPLYRQIMRHSYTRTAIAREQIAKTVRRACEAPETAEDRQKPATPDRRRSPRFEGRTEGRRDARPSTQRAVRIPTGRLANTAADEGRKRRSRLAEFEQTAGVTEEHVFHPHVNRSCPDFAALHEDFEKTMAKRRAATLQQLGTTSFRTFAGLESHEQRWTGKRRIPDERSPAGTAAPASRPPGASGGGRAKRPVTTTLSAELRTESRRKQEQERRERDDAELERRRQCEARARAAAARVRVRLHEEERRRGGAKGRKGLKAQMEAKRNRNIKLARREEKRQMREYRTQLDGIWERVMKRPCLFETVCASNLRGHESKANSSTCRRPASAKYLGAKDQLQIV